jgi:hypothetical protein
MVAFDSQSIAPQVWSLAPEDTLALVFWTKNPKKLLENRKLLDPYNVIVHMTITGWHEAEDGVPGYQEAAALMYLASQSFKVYWRFSPIPILPLDELEGRFSYLLNYASLASGLDRVYVSFLQENDRVPETRSWRERRDILNMLADKARSRDVEVILCSDDRDLWTQDASFSTGPCVPATDFEREVRSEDCGCVLMADPFTVNESCGYNCAYCYAADKILSFERRDTT